MADIWRKVKLAEQVERYEDMTKMVKEVVEQKTTLSVEERNLLSVAYKNVIGARRNSWRVLTATIDQKKDKEAERMALAMEYRETIEKELHDISREVLDLLENNLIPNSKEDTNGHVFYLKMKGDYYRYLCEITTGDVRAELVGKAKEAYETAQETASSTLKSTSPIRLGLALNFSVFHYEIANEKDEACSLAKKAFDEAVNDLDSEDEAYQDSTLIMQLLKDNLTLWTSAEEDEDAGDDDIN